MPFDKESYAGDPSQHRDKSFKQRLFVVIFGTDTLMGKRFDVLLIWMILVSVLAVMLESVDYIREDYGLFLSVLEWIITICFTIEYMARIWVVRHPRKYIFSFFGIIDFLSILPTYLSILIVGSQSLALLRAVRLLRIFKILNLSQFHNEGGALLSALKQSRYKIFVFFASVLILVSIMGSIMYFVEGPEHGFNSIPLSIYWAIVTLTTVGFGDITPQTVLGQIIASFIMLIGYSIIAIPTGIVGAEIYSETAINRKIKKDTACRRCGERMHLAQATHCHQCGEVLREKSQGIEK